MKAKARTVKLLSSLLMAGTLVSGAAHAQLSPSVLPAGSGDALLWAAEEQSLLLHVAVAGPVKLELSASRGAGDTTFTLLNAAGQPVLAKTVTPGERGWETLFEQDLAAGTYRLQAQRTSPGATPPVKGSSFALRLTGTGTRLSPAAAHTGQTAPTEPAAVAPAPNEVPQIEVAQAAVTQADALQADGTSAAPAISRSSTVSLPFDAPRESQRVTVAQRLPAGATLVPGSSRLDGQPVAEPLRGPSGTLYWVLNAPVNHTAQGAAIRGVLSYELAHGDALGELPAASLQVGLSGNRSEVLQGQIDEADLRGAAVAVAQTGQSENSGAIKLPSDGTVVQIRDRISVTVEAPQGAVPTLTVNGVTVPPDTIGTNVQDGGRGVQRLTFVGVPLQVGANVLRFLNDEITVYLVGATAKFEVEPLALQADGSSPVRVRLRALDAFGKLTSQPTVTVRTNLEPRLPDASPGEPGYQVRLTGGEGVLELQPQGSPVGLKLELLQGEEVKTYRYEVTPDRSRVGIGVLSATLGLDGDVELQDDLTWQARGAYEGPLGAGKLYVAADKDGLPTDRNTLIRNTVYGDASTESVPLQGIDPVAFSYDHPKFRAEYRRTSLPIDVLPVGENLTALTAYSKTNPRVSGFVALVPEDRVVNRPLTPEGTRLLRLGDTGVSLGSETLELVTLERSSGKELQREKLVRNVDYVLDPRSGVVTFNRAIDRLDAELNERVVYASYRLDNPLANRRTAYGVQIKTTGTNSSVGVAAVYLDGRTTYGVKADYQRGPVKASGLVAYSGGVQASADLSTVLARNHDLNFRVRYQQASYEGLAPFAPGLVVSGRYTGRLTPRLNAVADAEYRDMPSPRASDVENANRARGGNVTARAVYHLDPFTVGGGVSYAFGDRSGLGLVGSVGYQREPISVDVVHTQPIIGDLDPTTDISSRFRIRKDLTLGFNDKITWGVGQAAALTLDTMIGNVNYAVGYELPTASGAGNRARFGATTTLPLNDRTALNLRGNVLYDVGKGALEGATGADINYKTDRLSATVGTDVSYRGDTGFGVVLRGGVTGSVTDELTLNAGGTAEFGQGRRGQRVDVGYAYRGRSLSSLGYGRYVAGSLAGGQPELSFGVSAAYRLPNWAVRGGVESRTQLDDRDSFTLQGWLGSSYYLTDRLAVGAWARGLTQPASQTILFGYGVEGSVRPLPGTWLTAGYNFRGFEGFQSSYTYTRQGPYLRLDLTLDETLGQPQR